MRFELKQKSLLLKNKTLNPLNLFRYNVLLLAFIVSFNLNSAVGQTDQQKLLSFSVENTSVSSALYKFSLQCGFDISYDASDTSLQKLITVSAKDKLAFEIYNEILKNTENSFKQIDNLIVIYKSDTGDDSNSDESTLAVLPFNDTIVNSSIPDTVYINDTVFRTKTDTLLITKTDTLRLVDTVFIVKPGRDKLKQMRKNQNDLITKHVPRRNGWSAEVFFSPFASTFSLSEENSSFKLRNFSIGGEFTKIHDKLNISAGIQLTHFADNYNNEYVIKEGGYYETDTIDIYYTIVDTDTSWYYVTDSSWLPIDNHQYNYNIKNRLGYLDLGISATYDFALIGKSRIYAGLGI
ncbi:MAG: hypothetical protein C0598_12670, partial [Marinilabiliales bacterium]